MQIPTLRNSIGPFIIAYTAMMQALGRDDAELWDQAYKAMDRAADAMREADQAPGPRRLRMLFARLTRVLTAFDDNAPSSVFALASAKLAVTAKRAKDQHPEAATIWRVYDEVTDRLQRENPIG